MLTPKQARSARDMLADVFTPNGDVGVITKVQEAGTDMPGAFVRTRYEETTGWHYLITLDVAETLHPTHARIPGLNVTVCGTYMGAAGTKRGFADNVAGVECIDCVHKLHDMGMMRGNGHSVYCLCKECPKW